MQTGERMLDSTIQDHHQWLVACVSESLLLLANKLRSAEKRINGKVTHASAPPTSIDPGVCSCVDSGKLRFMFRFPRKKVNVGSKGLVAVNGVWHPKSIPNQADNRMEFPILQQVQSCSEENKLENHGKKMLETVVAAAKESETAKSDNQINKLIDVSEVDISVADSQIGKLNDLFDAVAMTSLSDRFNSCGSLSDPLVLKKLTVLERSGPSLWPFLSSVKTSVDAEHAKFMDTNCDFLSSYSEMDVFMDYTRPLSDNDVEILLENAVETALQSRKARFLNRLSNGWNNANSSPQKCNQAGGTSTESDMNHADLASSASVSQSSQAPMVISKRYAAAIANPRRFKCKMCPYSTNNRSHVRRHHISVHSDARPYRCYVCGKEFARSENAKVHIQSRHVGVAYDSEKIKSKHYLMLSGDSAMTSYDSDTPSAVSPEPVQSSISEAQLRGNVIPILPNIKTEPADEVPFKKFKTDTGSSVAPAPVVTNPMVSNSLLFSNVLSLLANGSTNGSLGSADIASLTRWAEECRPCPLCRYPCRDATDLLRHLALSHGDANIGLLPKLAASGLLGTTGFPQLGSSSATGESCLGSVPGLHNLNTSINVALAPQINSISGFASCAPLMNPVSAFGAPPSLNPIAPLFSGAPPLNANMTQPLRYVFLNSVQPQAMPVAISNEMLAEASKMMSQHFRPILPKVENALKIPVPVPLPTAPQPKIQSATEKCTVATQSPPPPPLQTGSRPPRSFKTFFCNLCPDRAPFRYRKSFDKHLSQHRVTDGIVGSATGKATMTSHRLKMEDHGTNGTLSTSASNSGLYDACEPSSGEDEDSLHDNNHFFDSKLPA